MTISTSPPSRGAWIEIEQAGRCQVVELSPPSRGAWIEMLTKTSRKDRDKSPPSRGAWIEIIIVKVDALADEVAPLAGGVD